MAIRVKMEALQLAHLVIVSASVLMAILEIIAKKLSLVLLVQMVRNAKTKGSLLDLQAIALANA